MKVCIAFFGIMRWLSHTKDSILKNIISPLSAFFDLELVVHFHEDAFDEKPEGGLVEDDFLPFDDIKIIAADDLERASEFQTIESFGDYWNDDFKGTRNLLFKLKSLQALHDFPQVRGIDICFSLRSRQMIHDSFSNFVVPIRNLKENQILVPFGKTVKVG